MSSDPNTEKPKSKAPLIIVGVFLAMILVPMITQSGAGKSKPNGLVPLLVLLGSVGLLLGLYVFKKRRQPK